MTGRSAATLRPGHGRPGPPVRAGLAIEYAFTEGSGQQVFNQRGTRMPRANLFGASEPYHSSINPLSWAASSATITDAYAANPVDGQQTAARLVVTAAANGFFEQFVTLPTAQHTMSLWVKSNTGSSQDFRMSDATSGTTATRTATTSWQQLSLTFSPTAGVHELIAVWVDGVGGALDLVIYGLQVQPGAVAGTYTPPVFDLTLGKTGAADTTDPAWSAVGINTSGSKYLFAQSSVGVSLAQCAFYVLARRPAGAVTATYAPLLVDSYGSNRVVLMGNDSGQPRFSLNGAPAATSGDMLATAGDGLWHTWWGNYDGTTISLYLDDVLLASGTGAVTTYTLHKLFVSAANSAGYWPGDIAYVLGYNQGHTTVQAASIRDWLKVKLAGRSQTYVSTLQRFVAFEGDSLTTFGLSGYQYAALNGQSSIPNGRTYAITGSQVVDMTNRAAGLDLNYNVARARNVLHVFIGANDLSNVSAATFVASLKTYCLARRATGWRIILATVLPQTTVGFNTVRNTANALIYGDTSFYDYLSDFAADPTVGPDAAASNTTYYNADGKHLVAAGHAILAPIVQASIAAALA
jgi:hypothetical protein